MSRGTNTRILYLVTSMTNLQQVGDPVIFENATISLEAVTAVLVREGHIEEAEALQGLEVISPSSAAVALDALRSLTPRTPEATIAIQFAMAALYRASKLTFVRHAAD